MLNSQSLFSSSSSRENPHRPDGRLAEGRGLTRLASPFHARWAGGLLIAVFALSCVSTTSEEEADYSEIDSEIAWDAEVPPAPKLTGDGIFYVVGENPKHPFVRYADGQLSMSESCAIKMENKLNRRIPPAHVNGLPIGFC